jgi:hypothetical protein
MAGHGLSRRKSAFSDARCSAILRTIHLTEQAMTRLGVAALLIALGLIALGSAASAPARADATLVCDFSGRTVKATITNSKDGSRSCNAWCVWYYGRITYRGNGGAALDSGESKTVYNSIAPVKIDGLAAKDLQCNR